MNVILLIFGIVYAVCLAILAVVFLGAKPLPSRGTGRDARREHAAPSAANVFSTHH